MISIDDTALGPIYTGASLADYRVANGCVLEVEMKDTDTVKRVKICIEKYFFDHKGSFG